MPLKLVVILATCFILTAVVDLIRREKMTFKYAFFWLAGCAVACFFTIYDELLIRISRLAGFELASNFIFFMLLVFVMFLSLLLSLHINEQNSRSEALAQAVAQLEHELKKIQAAKKD